MCAIIENHRIDRLSATKTVVHYQRSIIGINLDQRQKIFIAFRTWHSDPPPVGVMLFLVQCVNMIQRVGSVLKDFDFFLQLRRRRAKIRSRFDQMFRPAVCLR